MNINVTMSINIENLTISDFDKICRTCSAQGEMLPLFETCLQNICIVEMLMSCSFVQINKSDGLPEHICLNCISELDQAYKFAQKCENIEKSLQKRIAKLRGIVKNNTNVNSTARNRNRKTGFQSKTKVKLKTITKNQSKNRLQTIESEQNLLIKNEDITEIQNLECAPLYTETNNVKAEEFRENINNEHDVNLEQDINCNKSKDEDHNNSDDDTNWSEDYYTNHDKPTKKEIKIRKRQRGLPKGPPYTCKSCNIKFETYSAFQDHRKKVKHSKIRRKICCSVCQKELASSQLKQHMRTHTKERPYVCTYCGRGFSLHRNMKRHMMIHTGERPYKCEHCDKAFIQYTSLKEHMNKHSGQTPFVCSVCGTTFKYNAMLRKHMRSKHPEQSGGQEDLFEHECPTCYRRYHTKQILRQHLLIHGEKTYLCSVCGKGFYNNAGLQTHIKVHTGHRPHACKVCGKAFRQTSGLKMHVLIHTGEKPYACSICNKAFTQRNHLRYHMRTHTGEKPYTCTVCSKSFSTNGTLTVHKRIHTGETPYLCPICGKGFYDSSSMKKHKRGHGESEQIQETT